MQVIPEDPSKAIVEVANHHQSIDPDKVSPILTFFFDYSPRIKSLC